MVYEYGANISDFWQAIPFPITVSVAISRFSTPSGAPQASPWRVSSLSEQDLLVQDRKLQAVAAEPIEGPHPQLRRVLSTTWVLGLEVEQLQEAFAILEDDVTQALASHRAFIAQAGCFREGPFIAFDGVSIETPTGTPLLKGLSFKATRTPAGKRVAGGARPTSGDLWAQRRREVLCLDTFRGRQLVRSSIFRCLAGLWPVAKGTITCPNASESRLRGQGPRKQAWFYVDR